MDPGVRQDDVCVIPDLIRDPCSYCGFTPIAEQTDAQRFDSERMCASSCSGEPPTKRTPCATNWSRNAGSLKALLISAFSRSVGEGGIFAGPSRAYHASVS